MKPFPVSPLASSQLPLSSVSSVPSVVQFHGKSPSGPSAPLQNRASYTVRLAQLKTPPNSANAVARTCTTGR
jgi:hypothetical protein